MNEAWNQVLQELPPGPAEGMYAPVHERSIAGLLPTALRLMGCDPGPDRAHLAELYDRYEGRRFKKLFFFMLDSLGLDEVLRRQGLLRRWYEASGMWLTSVFPTITSSAITSIFHGVPPGVHGVTGHKIYQPSVGRVVDMLKLSVDGHSSTVPQSGVDVRAWTPTRPLLDSGVIRGIPAFNVTHETILNSGLSFLVFPDTMHQLGYRTTIEGFSRSVRVLRHADEVIVCLYSNVIDHVSHSFGKDSPEYEFQYRQVEAVLQWLLETIPPEVQEETLFVLASDHGQDVHDPAQRIILDEDMQKELGAWGRYWPLGHTGRVLHFYGGDSEMPRGVRSMIDDHVGEKGVLIGQDAASRLAGVPEGAEAPLSLGSHLLSLHPGAHFEMGNARKRDAERARKFDTFSSNHGSLAPHELLVPGLLAPMSDLNRA